METLGSIEVSVAYIWMKMFISRRKRVLMLHLKQGFWYLLCEINWHSFGICLYCGHKLYKIIVRAIYLRADKTEYKIFPRQHITKECSVMSIVCHDSLT